jgi:hypothetical protein
VPSLAPSAAAIAVRGQILTAEGGYVIFTTGAAIRLGAATLPKGAALGRSVRVRLDPQTHAAQSIQLAGNPLPGDVDAAHIPAEYLAGRSAAASPAPGTSRDQVEVIVEVEVPPLTPLGDDIYLTTERTSFSPAELKMNRVDNTHWIIKLTVANGSVMRYRFTRGNATTTERTQAGTVPDPHQLSAGLSLHTHDTVARWADQN